MKAERLGKVLYEMTHASGSSKSAHDSFVAYIHARGYAKLLPRILSEYERLSTSAKKSDTIVTAAKNLDMKEILRAHGIDEKVETRIDETIVGGYTIETDSRFIDASHKNALIRLYQTLTH
jgi:F0F1-type ATP synthase delta subunit